jgi:hypothetical protein
MFTFMAITRALADQNRVRVLTGRELCVCQIVELLEPAPLNNVQTNQK